MPVLKKKRNAKPRLSQKLSAEQLKWRDHVFAVYCSLRPKRSIYKLEMELKARHAKLAAHKTTLLRWSSQFNWVKRAAKFDTNHQPAPVVLTAPDGGPVDETCLLVDSCARDPASDGSRACRDGDDGGQGAYRRGDGHAEEGRPDQGARRQQEHPARNCG